jgi:hypothetical protein
MIRPNIREFILGVAWSLPVWVLAFALLGVRP